MNQAEQRMIFILDKMYDKLSLMEKCLFQSQNANIDLVKRMNELEEEIEVLRLYGNKDCTAMADEELQRRRSNENI
jgi:hypothetical protein